MTVNPFSTVELYVFTIKAFGWYRFETLFTLINEHWSATMSIKFFLSRWTFTTSFCGFHWPSCVLCQKTCKSFISSGRDFFVILLLSNIFLKQAVTKLKLFVLNFSQTATITCWKSILCLNINNIFKPVLATVLKKFSTFEFKLGCRNWTLYFAQNFAWHFYEKVQDFALILWLFKDF